MAKLPSFSSSVPSWWERGWLIALLFLFPTHWFLQLSDAQAYVQGLRVDYLILKLFVSQVLIWLVLLGWGWRERARWPEWLRAARRQWMEILCVAALATTQLLSQRPVIGLWQLLTLMTAGGLAIYLWHHRRWVAAQPWITVVAAALAFHSVIALAQWWTQGSVFSSYWWFGEPRLLGQPGLATSTWWGRELMLPYGVTAHPNVLAGSFVFYLIILFRNQEKLQSHWSIIKWGSVLFGLVALGLTQSITAFLGVGAGLSWFLFSHTEFFKRNVARLHHTHILSAFALGAFGVLVTAPLLLAYSTITFSDSSSFVRRTWLADAAWNMWKANPFFGVGLQQFTTQVEQFSTNAEVVRFVQPVHHVGLLWLAETGIVGVGLFMALGFFTLRRIFQAHRITHVQHKILLARNLGTVTLIILPLLINDHYLLTSPAGLIGIIFLTYFSFLADSNS